MHKRTFERLPEYSVREGLRQSYVYPYGVLLYANTRVYNELLSLRRLTGFFVTSPTLYEFMDSRLFLECVRLEKGGERDDAGAGG